MRLTHRFGMIFRKLAVHSALPPSFVMALSLVFLTLVTAAPAKAQTPAEASRPPLSIAIFVSSRKDVCFDPGDVLAIKRLATAEQDRINASGGVLQRQLQLRILDDARTPERAVANVREALGQPHTVAMVGLPTGDNAKAVFDALGKDVGASGIPFLSDITVNSIFEDHANVFTMRPSQDEERIPALAAFIKARGIKRPAFVGLKDALFSSSLGDGLNDLDDGPRLVADHRLTVQNNKIDPAAIGSVVADLKEKDADMVFLAIGGQRTPALLSALVAAKVTPPLFVTGRIESIVEASGGEYPGDIFQLAWEGLPEVFSERLRQRVLRNGIDRWVFAGAKVPQAPGWAKGECKERPEAEPDVFDSQNMRAIGRGTQYADMVALVAEALKSADPKSNIAGLRAHLLKQLKTTYAAGRGAFRGSFENWSFRPDSRTADRPPFIIMRPKGLGASQLAPLQFVRLRSDKLRRIDTLYADVDLIRAFRIDENDKSFMADFYLSMRGRSASIDKIDFANSFVDPQTNDRQLHIRTLHDGSPSEVYPEQMKIYRISGKFMFEPRLANFPFDTQRFAISIQPKSSDAPFMIQPPPHALRDKIVATDGWAPHDQYVSYDEDFIPTIDAWTLQPSVVPFYKASFVWLMKREATDYYLRVVVPLGFILIVAYLSIFIPSTHFEAIVTIQVTALLSSVALYLALPKIDSDSTTVSDRIFLFTYMAVSLMVAISVFRISSRIAHRRWLKKMLGFAHIVLIPALAAGMAFYIYRASLAG